MGKMATVPKDLPTKRNFPCPSMMIVPIAPTVAPPRAQRVICFRSNARLHYKAMLAPTPRRDAPPCACPSPLVRRGQARSSHIKSSRLSR